MTSNPSSPRRGSGEGGSEALAGYISLLATIDPDGEQVEASMHRSRMREIEEEHYARMLARELAETRQPSGPSRSELLAAALRTAAAGLDAWQGMARRQEEARWKQVVDTEPEVIDRIREEQQAARPVRSFRELLASRPAVPKVSQASPLARLRGWTGEAAGGTTPNPRKAPVWK